MFFLTQDFFFSPPYDICYRENSNHSDMGATTTLNLGGTKVAVPNAPPKDKVNIYCHLTYIIRTRIDTDYNVSYFYRTQSNNIMLVKRQEEGLMRS